MVKIDYKKELKSLYNPPLKPVIVDVPEMSFLMIDGSGYPGTSKEYLDAMQTLYPASYTIKFIIKKQGTDYGVMPLEGLWWADDMEHFLDDKDKWKWTAMIMQPPCVDEATVAEALEQLGKKKSPPAIDKVRFERFAEGRAAQVMYFGPYSDEGPTIERLHAFIAENGYGRSGKHHEIYLGDPRRSAPEKLKTVIRQPVK
jgi:hypothetical protein